MTQYQYVWIGDNDDGQDLTLEPNNNWDTPQNWEGGPPDSPTQTVPGSDDLVHISGTYAQGSFANNAAYVDGTGSAYSVALLGPVELLDQLNVQVGSGGISIGTGSVVDLETGGTLADAGDFNFENSYNDGYLVEFAAGGDVTVTGNLGVGYGSELTVGGTFNVGTVSPDSSVSTPEEASLSLVVGAGGSFTDSGSFDGGGEADNVSDIEAIDGGVLNINGSAELDDTSVTAMGSSSDDSPSTVKIASISSGNNLSLDADGGTITIGQATGVSGGTVTAQDAGQVTISSLALVGDVSLTADDGIITIGNATGFSGGSVTAENLSQVTISSVDAGDGTEDGTTFTVDSGSSIEIGATGADVGQFVLGGSLATFGTITAPEIVINGTLEVEEGQTEELSGQLSGIGKLQIDNGSVLMLDNGAAPSGLGATIVFDSSADSTGTLELGVSGYASDSITPTIDDFQAGDIVSLDSLSGATILGETSEGGNLVVSVGYAGSDAAPFDVTFEGLSLGQIAASDDGSALDLEFSNLANSSDTYTWTGAGPDTLWSDPANWDLGGSASGTAPGSSSTATIAGSSGDPAMVGGGGSANMLTLSDVEFLNGSYDVTVVENQAGATTVDADATLAVSSYFDNVANATLTVAGTVTIGTELIVSSDGAIDVDGGSLTTGSIYDSPASGVTDAAYNVAPGGSFTDKGDFSSDGDQITDAGYFDVGGDATLTGDTITIGDANQDGSNFYVNVASLSNNTINVLGNTSFGASYGISSNNDQINVDGGRVDVTGGATLTGDTLTIEDAGGYGGSFNVDTAALSNNTISVLADSSFNASDGISSNNDQISVSGGTFDVAGSTTLTGDTITIGDTAGDGGSFTIDATLSGNTINVFSSASFTGSGDLSSDGDTINISGGTFGVAGTATLTDDDITVGDANDGNGGTLTLANATLAGDMIYLQNGGTATLTSVTNAIDTNDNQDNFITVNDSSSSFEIGGDGNAVGGDFYIDNGETFAGGGQISAIQIVVDGVLEVQAGDSETLNGQVSGGGTLQIDGDATLTLSSGLSSTATAIPAIAFDGNGANLALNTAYSASDTLALSQGAAGEIITIENNGTPVDSFDLSGSYTQPDFQLEDVNGDVSIVLIACFLAGTRIRTDRGEVPIEQLGTDDRVITASGAVRPVRWIGHRRIDTTRAADPASLWPIAVRVGAFAENVPARDLWLSPGHNVVVRNALMPISALVNGRTVEQAPCPVVEYWHLELDQHDIILAEGLPTETYLDTGNRAAFEQDETASAAHLDNPHEWWDTCLPLLFDGPRVERARTELLARANTLGHEIIDDPDLHIIADGRRIEATPVSETSFAFLVAADCKAITLRSRSFVPAHIEPASQDGRVLGVCVNRLQIDGDDIPLDDEASFDDGWHKYEQNDAQRWSKPVTPLPAGARLVVIGVAGFPRRYWADREGNLVSLFRHA